MWLLNLGLLQVNVKKVPWNVVEDSKTLHRRREDLFLTTCKYEIRFQFAKNYKVPENS